MNHSDLPLERLLAALAIGLLVGIERERRKGDHRAAAGLRTFAAASLLGGLAFHLGGAGLLAAALLALAAYAVAGYLRERGQDPGLTTETALLAVCLLGGLAVSDPAPAAAVAVALTLLLAERERMHAFARRALSDTEIRDGLLFLAAALLVLPLIPDAPFAALSFVNLRTLWRLLVLIMGISGAGYLALRTAGPRFGLPLAGLTGGFVSSTLTIGAMGGRAAATPALRHAAAAGALLSNVATAIQLLALLAVASPAVLKILALPLLAMAATAALTALLQGRRAFRETEGRGLIAPGRAFNFKTAALFALLVVGMGGIGAWLTDLFGNAGAYAATACTGLLDAHAAAAAAATLVGTGKLPAETGAVLVLIGLTANAASKLVAARTGGAPFFRAVAPSLLAIPAVPWLVWVLVARFAGG